MPIRIGVLADSRGWRAVGPDRHASFANRDEALREARRWASLSRWRGLAAEVVVQDRPGGELRRTPIRRVEPVRGGPYSS